MSDDSEGEEDDVAADEFDEPFTARTDVSPEELEIADLARELDRLETAVYDMHGELSRFERAVDERTVKRPTLEADLRRYVRQRMRRSRARGWGPYLVLLYGTVMTIGAFYKLDGGWAILAMIVLWLSTLGLYALMLIVGAGLRLIGVPMRLRDAIANRRS